MLINCFNAFERGSRIGFLWENLPAQSCKCTFFLCNMHMRLRVGWKKKM
jgi:hypothetical protein